MPVEAVAFPVVKHQVFYYIIYGKDVVAHRAQAPAQLYVAAAFFDYAAALRFLFQRAVGFPFVALVYELLVILEDAEIRNTAFPGIAYGNVPFGAFRDRNVPLLDHHGMAVPVKAHPRLYIPYFLGRCHHAKHERKYEEQQFFHKQ